MSSSASTMRTSCSHARPGSFTTRSCCGVRVPSVPSARSDSASRSRPSGERSSWETLARNACFKRSTPSSFSRVRSRFRRSPSISMGPSTGAMGAKLPSPRRVASEARRATGRVTLLAVHRATNTAVTAPSRATPRPLAVVRLPMARAMSSFASMSEWSSCSRSIHVSVISSSSLVRRSSVLVSARNAQVGLFSASPAKAPYRSAASRSGAEATFLRRATTSANRARDCSMRSRTTCSCPASAHVTRP